MKTAVVMPMQRDSSFGDLMVQGPFLFGLRQLGADRVVIISPNGFLKILEKSGIVDKVYILKDNESSQIKEVLRKENPFWAVTLRASSFRSTLFIRSCKGAVTAGWGNFLNNLLLKKTVKRVRDTYYALVFGRLLKKLGCDIETDKFAKDLASRHSIDSNLLSSKRFICMPGGNLDSKQWGHSNYIALGRLLLAKHMDLKLIVILGPREENLKSHFENNGWQVLVSPSINNTVALCQGAFGVVANDCGPSHLAQMSGVPIVVIYHHASEMGFEKRRELIDLWWWKRKGSCALSTKIARPVNEIPVEVVYQQLEYVTNEDKNSECEIVFW